MEVTLPDSSTSTSGPSHETSKYDLMTMLYADGVKKRLLMGARVVEALERKADKAAKGRRWGMLKGGGGGGARGEVQRR